MKDNIFTLFLTLLGSISVALGVVVFLAPNHVVTGGTAGLSMLLNYALPISIGGWMLLINLPLVLLGWQKVGKKFALHTIFCIFLIAIATDFFVKYIHLKPLSNNLFLATLYGSILVGVGLGFIFKAGASAGGVSIIAKLLFEKYQIKQGNVLLVLDAIIVILAGIIFKNTELALWSLIGIFVTSKLIDAIILGTQTHQIVHISSTKNLHELSKIMANEMKISGTIVKGNDLQLSEYKDIIFVMVEKNRLHELKKLALSYDTNVKMIVMQAIDVLGKT